MADRGLPTQEPTLCLEGLPGAAGPAGPERGVTEGLFIHELGIRLGQRAGTVGVTGVRPPSLSLLVSLPSRELVLGYATPGAS